MIRHGEAPYLECSTRGDRRFSAFGAKVYGTTIEELYQLSKLFADGTSPTHWREGKGRHAVNAEELAELYEMLWRAYFDQHRYLLPVLAEASGLSDMFGQKGHVCQATVLWKIRNELLVDTRDT